MSFRIFEDCEFDKECPICKTKKKGDGILIGIDGTEKGNNIQADLVHTDCLNLRIYNNPEFVMIAQRVEK